MLVLSLIVNQSHSHPSTVNALLRQDILLALTRQQGSCFRRLDWQGAAASGVASSKLPLRLAAASGADDHADHVRDAVTKQCRQVNRKALLRDCEYQLNTHTHPSNTFQSNPVQSDSIHLELFMLSAHREVGRLRVAQLDQLPPKAHLRPSLARGCSTPKRVRC